MKKKRLSREEYRKIVIDQLVDRSPSRSREDLEALNMRSLCNALYQDYGFVPRRYSQPQLRLRHFATIGKLAPPDKRLSQGYRGTDTVKVA